MRSCNKEPRGSSEARLLKVEGPRQGALELLLEVGMWTRLCVDLDAAGNVAGASWELHDVDGALESFGTAPFGPFDTAAEVFQQLMDAHLHEHGHRITLF